MSQMFIQKCCMQCIQNLPGIIIIILFKLNNDLGCDAIYGGRWIPIFWTNLWLQFVCPKDGGSRFYQGVNTYIQDSSVLHPRSL
jgi:hypothetical protein